MKKWITSDWHLDAERMKFLGRQIISHHNWLVAPDDEVIIVGDVCMEKEFLSLIDKFHGKKTLIRGNHDSLFSDEEFAPYFETIIPDGEGLELEIEGVPCYATHYPTTGRKDCFNLVGHVHAIWKYQLNMFNIGWDANNFKPVNLDTIPSHLKLITEEYDEDVWAAYNEINTDYCGIRGKKGTYFKGM